MAVRGGLDKKELGFAGEAVAAKEYVSRGYGIVARNWRCGKIGEVDIIAEKDGFVVFSEVKTRNNSSFASPSAAVNFKKQRKIRQMAEIYFADCVRRGIDFIKNIRFDVVEVYPAFSGRDFAVNVLENAF